ncbi:tetratricopeptide repeat protein [Nesterenkonia populi]|uniref:tetratricopeptide repeat protein n=1 Tax=Nesterenkonia populi TaxID=1591087 RepID=UPI00147955AB|nr:tetratricopeptide repeat protein [Nesterenkonia populi]
MLKPQVLGAEAGRRAIRILGRIPGAEPVLARAIIASARTVPTPVQAEFNGHDPKLRRLHAQAATVLFEANPRGAQQVLEDLDLETAQNADQLERMAVRYMKLGEFEAALAMRRRAVALEPEDPQRHLALARALQRATRSGPTPDPVLGLRDGGHPQVNAARESLRKAEQLAPSHPAVLHEQGHLEFTHGDPDQGLALLEQAVTVRPSAAWYKDIGQRYRKPHIGRLDDALAAYEKALKLNPTDGQVFRSVIVLGCRAGHNWPRHWDSAERYETSRGWKLPGGGHRRRSLLVQEFADLFTGEPISEARAQAAVVRLEETGSSRGRLSWQTTALIAYRLQFAGHVGAGYRLRRQLAARTRAWLGTVSGGHVGHRRKLLAALVYLDRLDEALKLIDPMPWQPQNRLAEQQLQKLAADTHLLRGSTEPYLEYSRTARAEDPMPAETLTEQVVAGKRVVIVGPVDTGDRLGALIDSYDVIVRPRFAPEFVEQDQAAQGSRTDIVYLNDHDIHAAVPLMREAVSAGELQLAVARPPSLSRHRDIGEPWLRFSRQEFALSHHGALLGIPRMVYDLAQFEPAEIAVLNTDLYTGTDAFAAGYRDTKDTVFGPGSAMNDLIVNHDLRFDFTFLQRMQDAGLLTAHGRTAEVLALTPDEYVHALETGSALR